MHTHRSCSQGLGLGICIFNNCSKRFFEKCWWSVSEAVNLFPWLFQPLDLILSPRTTEYISLLCLVIVFYLSAQKLSLLSPSLINFGPLELEWILLIIFGLAQSRCSKNVYTEKINIKQSPCPSKILLHVKIFLINRIIHWFPSHT